MDTNRIDVARLPESIQTWIEEKLASGHYNSPEDVLEAAAGALELLEIRAKIQVALDQEADGKGTVYDAGGLKELTRRVCARGEERLRRKRDSADS